MANDHSPDATALDTGRRNGRHAVTDPVTDAVIGAVSDLPTADLASAYDHRGLDRLDDDTLVAAVAAVVAEPREGPPNSFVLHAPLELTARAQLLAVTSPEWRRLARLRLVSIAARYHTYEPSTPVAPAESGDDVDAAVDAAVDAVVRAVAAGDLAGAEAAALALSTAASSASSAASGGGAGAGAAAGLLDRIVGPLAPAVADRTSAAAHGPILLATMVEAPDRAVGWLDLLRPLVRELARRADWRISWIDRAAPTVTTAPAATTTGDRPWLDGVAAALADPPRLGRPDPDFIHPMVMQVDAPGAADELLAPTVGRTATDEASRMILRLAATSMVRDDPGAAPYGWTHSLTLPQAVLTVAPQIEAAGGEALAVAATHLLAFRAAQATVAVDPTDPLVRPADPATVGSRRRALIDQAARRHDAHVAKYLRSVLTEADRDPDAGELYLAAGEHLLRVWDDLGPDPDDLLADAVVG
ncbi:MAG: hypothetical protein AAGA93_05775 [Actinomycetota bacterium]